MPIEAAFLQDILAHPDDDAPRLIYADWLEEHNNPRGEFIRVQCALAQLDGEDPRRWPLEQHEGELLRQFEQQWLTPLRELLHGQPGLVPVPATWVSAPSPPQGEVRGSSWRFRRGFIEEITLTPEEFLLSAERVFAQTPIRRLHLRQRERYASAPEGSDGPLARVARSRLLSWLTGLSLTLPLSRYDVQAFAESPHLTKLTELRLSGVLVEEDALLAWSKSPHRPRLRTLDLSGNPLPSQIVRALAETPYLSSLTALNVAHTGLSLEDVRSLAHSPVLKNLTTLNLGGNRLQHGLIPALAESPLLARLETLCLDANFLGDAGALALRRWPALPRLSRLALRKNQIFAIEALAQSPALEGLISLDLFDNIACDTGADALASSPYCRGLRALNLRFNGVDDPGVRALARSANLPELTWLNLTANRVTNKGAQALTESPYLRRLARLDLPRNDIGPVQRQRLRDRFGPYVYY